MVAQSPTRGEGLLEGWLAKIRARVVDSLIPGELREGKILDIGCGSHPYFLAKTIFAEKFGMDPNTDISGLEGEIELKRSYVSADSKLPYQDDFFNVVTMIAVVEHLEPSDLTFVFQEARRILKPGGRLIVTTPSPLADVLLKLMVSIGLLSKEEIEDHKAAYRRKDLRKLLLDAGFEERSVGTGHFELYLNNWATADKTKPL